MNEDDMKKRWEKDDEYIEICSGINADAINAEGGQVYHVESSSPLKDLRRELTPLVPASDDKACKDLLEAVSSYASKNDFKPVRNKNIFVGVRQVVL